MYECSCVDFAIHATVCKHVQTVHHLCSVSASDNSVDESHTCVVITEDKAPVTDASVLSDTVDEDSRRVRILKASRYLELLDPDSENIYMTGLVQRYAARPSSLDTMCLSDFPVEYDVCYQNSSHHTDDTDDIQTGEQLDRSLYDKKFITLDGGMGKMRHRKTRAILITHWFSQQTEPEKHYHSELMLFTACRDEERDLLGDFETYSESRASRQDKIDSVKKRFYHHADEVSDAVDEFFQHRPPVTAWDALASQQHQENSNCVEEGPMVETFVGCADDTILQTTFVESTATDAQSCAVSTDCPPMMTDEEFYSLTRLLNQRQQHLFQFVLDWCRAQCDATPPFCVFCTGGAGVGKSHVIHAIVQMANRELHRAGDNADDVIVLLTAPTGTAAYNIDGSTLHSAFLMTPKSDTLSAEKLATLRNKYSKLKLLIIDEVSMVGANLLKHVHERLAATAGLPTAAPFAGVSVFAVGDFQQLSPVGEPPLYKAPSSGYIALADLRMSNFKVELTDIMRQRSDTGFAELLTRLRVGNHTSDDINILKSRQVSVKEDDITYNGYPHIFSIAQLWE